VLLASTLNGCGLDDDCAGGCGVVDSDLLLPACLPACLPLAPCHLKLGFKNRTKKFRL